MSWRLDRTLALGSVLAASGCRAPTQIAVELSTDVPCAEVQGTAISVASPDELEGRQPTSMTQACDPSGRIGSLVIVPSGAPDAEIAFRVVLGHGKPVEQCAAPSYGAGCIVARRSLRFVEHASLTVPVVMRASCDGLPCARGETCRAGRCVPATIEDPSACEGAGCSEETLGPGAGGAPDAGSADSGARDGGDAESGSTDGDAPGPVCGSQDGSTAQGCCCSNPIVESDLQDVGGGSTAVLSGALGTTDIARWHQIVVRDVPEPSANSYHVRIELTHNPGDALRFVALRGGSCDEEWLTPRVAAYDFCVDFRSAGAGLSPCGTQPDRSHCGDMTAKYEIGVVRKQGAACEDLAYTLRVSAAAGPCSGPYGCGSCAEGAMCLGGIRYDCKGGWIDSPCPDQASNPCLRPACVSASGACGYVPLPAGYSQSAAQPVGDCKKVYCDGAGSAVQQTDPSDLPDDKNPCTADSCNGSTPTFKPKTGTPCGTSGGVCRSSGACGCKPGSTDCSDSSTKVTCNSVGEWVSPVKCSNGCASGACK
jgi:hypothetical protein